MAIGYIYNITNLLNDKIYIGKHKSKTFDFNYWGSGLNINRAIKKYGIENFYRDVIEWCDTLEELNKQEKFYIKEWRTRNPLFGYNITEGGEDCETFYGRHHSKKSRQLISLHNSRYWKGRNKSPEHVLKISLTLKGRPNFNTRKKVILNKTIVFDSVKDCCKYSKISDKHIWKYLKTGRLYKGNLLEYYEKL